MPPLQRLIAIVFLAAIPAAAEPPPGLSPDRVGQAVKRGTEWLRTQAQADGSWKGNYHDSYPGGPTALAIYALASAGAPPDDPALMRGFTYLLPRIPSKVYTTSNGILAMAARYAPPSDRFRPGTPEYARECARRFGRAASDAERDWLARSTAFLIKGARGGAWAYPDGDADLSNTQFAVLALSAAARLGATVQPEVFAAALVRLLDDQEVDGPAVDPFDVPAADFEVSREGATTTEPVRPFKARGWGYRVKEAPRGSMTAAGVACLVAIKAELAGTRGYQKAYSDRTDAGIRDGAAWLARNLSVETNPGLGNTWRTYWLFSLQRAGVLCGCERFGPWDWYANGARWLLEHQRADGRWEVDGDNLGPIVDTAFALLFLRRATTAVLDRPVTGGAHGGGPTVERLQDGRFRVSFVLVGEGEATGVAVTGTWNDWGLEGAPMVRAQARPLWSVDVDLPAGTYRYKFVVDGTRWIQDPANPLIEDNGKGGWNSVLVLVDE